MMMTGIALAAFGLVATSGATSLYGIATGYSLSSMGFGFTRPAFTAGSSLAVGRKLQGLVAGHVTAINGASFVLGPSIGVVLYEVYRPLPFLIAAGVMILMIPYVRKRLLVNAEAESAQFDL